uniref:Uncharacterized protein n=1 Tax=Betaphycus gelatinus TaxID=1191690 RepID=A0A8E7UEJ7_9FLOR|nr:hypothetical protein [Betaphycus gelatinus]
MQYLNNVLDYDDYVNDELSMETPIGWSSVCFDQTINYYIECNSVNTHEIEIDNTENK